MDPASCHDRGNYTSILCQGKAETNKQKQTKQKKHMFSHTHFFSFLPSCLEVISKFKEDFGSQGELLSGDHIEFTQFSTLLVPK